MHRTMRVLGGVVAVVGLLAACGDDSDEAGTAESETTGTDAGETESAGPADGDCPFITGSEVAEAVGGDVELTAHGDDLCSFEVADSGTTFMVNYLEILTGDPEEFADEARNSCDDAVEDVDAGDVAYACQHFTGPYGAVYAGDSSVSITATSSEDEAADLQVIVEMLPLVRL